MAEVRAWGGRDLTGVGFGRSERVRGNPQVGRVSDLNREIQWPMHCTVLQCAALRIAAIGMTVQ